MKKRLTYLAVFTPWDTKTSDYKKYFSLWIPFFGEEHIELINDAPNLHKTIKQLFTNLIKNQTDLSLKEFFAKSREYETRKFGDLYKHDNLYNRDGTPNEPMLSFALGESRIRMIEPIYSGSINNFIIGITVNADGEIVNVQNRC